VTQIVLFLVALFSIPWILGFLLPPPSGDLSSFLVAFVPVVWTPTIIALLFVLAEGGPAGVRKELKARLSYRHGSGKWLLVASIVPILAMLVSVFSARAVGDGAPFIRSASIPQMIGLQIITGAIGEELGWRGFLLQRLGKRVGTIAAAWVMGVFWSLWHVPAFFDPNLPHQFMPMMLVLPFTAFFGVFMAFVFNRAGDSVLATMSAHLSLNIMTGLGGAALSSPMFWGVLAVLFGVLAVVISPRLGVPAPGH
jgi:membrane protease YdiL (CAAX protease family)